MGNSVVGGAGGRSRAGPARDPLYRLAIMARHDEPRPPRRRRLFAATTALAGFLACAVGLTAVAVTPPGPLPSVLNTNAPPGSISASPPEASHGASPAAVPSAEPPPLGPTRSAIRASATRALLDRELEAIRTRLGIPGVSVTIVFRDGTQWTGASGMADVAGGVPVTPESAFALASVSKTYTAALVLDLAGDGLIDLDAPAIDYLEGLALDPGITVRQLLDHTSGLDDYFLHPPIDRALLGDRAAFWSVARTLRYVGRPYFPPGTGWHYSNTNYVYLGLIAERVSGQTISTALRERFFTPLGLDATWYQAVEEPRAPTVVGYRFASTRLNATPVSLADGTGVAPFTSVVSAAAAAGSIAATSPDVARWARMLYEGDVLDADMTDEMLGGVALTAGYRPRVPYGLGVQAFSIAGRPSYGHSGRLLGFRSVVRHIPSEALTIAVLTNQSRADPAQILGALLDIVFRADSPCYACQRER